jgi:hypothetical protein
MLPSSYIPAWVFSQSGNVRTIMVGCVNLPYSWSWRWIATGVSAADRREARALLGTQFNPECPAKDVQQKKALSLWGRNLSGAFGTPGNRIINGCCQLLNRSSRQRFHMAGWQGCLGTRFKPLV